MGMSARLVQRSHDGTGLNEVSSNGYYRPNANRSEHPTMLGPFEITGSTDSPPFIEYVGLMYMVILFLAALSGPKTLFLMAWRLGMFLAAYDQARQRLAWNEDISRDVLLSSVERGINLVKKRFVDVLARFLARWEVTYRST